MSAIKKIIKKLLYREKASSDTYIKYLRKKGIEIGDNCVFHGVLSTVIDVTQPSLIKIGNNVEITSNVTVLCHDMAWCIFQKLTGEIIGSNKKTVIGSNVFIGMNSIILRGVTVGNNVIIGAGSVVSQNIPNNCVAAGNPARVISSLEDYYKKRKSEYANEAIELAQAYYEQNNIIPPLEMFRDFFPLFWDDNNRIFPAEFLTVIRRGGNEEKTLAILDNNKNSRWNTYDMFISEALSNSIK